MKNFLFLFCLCIGSLTAQSKVVVGIAGGSGSGKTTLAGQIHSAFPENSIVINQDAYYKSLAHLSLEERREVNFDHPDSLDFSLLRQNLLDLINGQKIEQPIYDFSVSDREKQTAPVQSAEIIIVEGILLFAIPEIRDLFDLKIYIDTECDIRILRRVERDIRERAQNVTQVKEQYLKTVKPMHDLFVEPSKRHADLIISGNESNQYVIDLIKMKLK